MRGPRLPIIHPFIGTSVAVSHKDDGDGNHRVSHSLRLRGGFDVRFPGDRWVLTASSHT